MNGHKTVIRVGTAITPTESFFPVLCEVHGCNASARTPQQAIQLAVEHGMAMHGGDDPWARYYEIKYSPKFIYIARQESKSIKKSFGSALRRARLEKM